ncbi:MAG: LCP family protein [Chloroflexota bacterium]
MPARLPSARATTAALAILASLAAIVPAMPGAALSPSPSVAPSASPCAVPPSAAASPPAAPSPGPSASPAPVDPCPRPAALDLGEDGRLTVLVLGTDYRDGLGGERTDAIIVMSLDPVTHRMVAASIPRDTSFFPRANGHTSGELRVNGLYDRYRDDALPHDQVDPKAIARFQRDVAAALGIEIDYHILTRFGGFTNLVDALGGIHVDIPATIVDDFIAQTGALFPQATDYPLKGDKDCTDRKPCHNPLLYARSRHGTVGDGYNSDFERSRRQQHLIVSAMQGALAAGFTDDQVADLLRVVGHYAWTDLPLTVEAAREAMALSEGVTLADTDSIVFGPRRWAYEDSTTPDYSFRLRVDDVRAWMASHLGITTASPSPEPSASPAA